MHIADRVARIIRIRAELVKQLKLDPPACSGEESRAQVECSLATYTLAVITDETNEILRTQDPHAR